MDKLTLDNAIRKILQAFTRGGDQSSERVDGWIRQMEFESEVSRDMAEYKTMNLDRLIDKYDFSGFEFGAESGAAATVSRLNREIHYNDVGGHQSPSEQARKIFDTYYGTENRLSWVRDMVDAAEANHTMTPMDKFLGAKTKKSVDRKKLVGELFKVSLDIENSVKQNILHYDEFLNQGTGGFTTRTSVTTKQNISNRSIAEALGNKVMEGIYDYNFMVVPEQFRGAKKVSTRNETGGWDSTTKPFNKSLTASEKVGETTVIYPNERLVNDAIFNDFTAFDKGYERDSAGEFKVTPQDFERHVLYMPGITNYGYAIPASKANMFDVARIFKNKISNPIYKIPEGLRAEWLESLGIIERTNQAGEKILDLNMENLNNPDGAAQWYKRILDTTTHMNVFGKNYAEQGMYDLSGEALGDLLRRSPQWSNAGANQLNDSYLRDVSTTYKDMFPNDKTLKKDSEFLDNLVGGNERLAVYKDEAAGDVFDILQKAQIEIMEKKYEDVPGVREYVERIEEYVHRFKDPDKRPSTQDAGTIVPSWKFDALARLYNVDVTEMAGGIKPIIFRAGDNWFISKTAFTRNSKYDKFFIDNPSIFGVTFTSATKSIAGKRSEYLENFINEPGDWTWNEKTRTATYPDPWYEGKFPDNRQLLPLKSTDLNISFAKGYKMEARISPNQFVGIDPTAGSMAYDYYISPRVGDTALEMKRLHDINNIEKAIAQNRSWTKESMEEATFDWIENSPLAAENMLAESNIIPWLSPHSKKWEKNLKTHMIDEALRPKVVGSQFVHQAIHPTETVENSVHVWDAEAGRARIHRLGQVRLGYHEQFKTIDTKGNHVFFIRKKEPYESADTGKDLHSISELIKVLKSEGNDVAAGNLRKARIMKEALDAIPHEWDMVGYYKRDPVISTDSVIPVRIHKNFKSEKDGNAGQINEMDGQMSAEMDNDIDIGNVWWNGPREYISEVIANKGAVPWGNSKPNKSSMDGIKSLWDKGNLSSSSDYRGLLKESDLAKGKLMNYQGIVDWLRRYNPSQMLMEKGGPSGFHIGKNSFVALRMGETEMREKNQQLRDDVQGIVDGIGGFDVFKYRNWEQDFLFNKSNGLFRGYFTEKKAHIPTESEIPVEGRTVILKHLIAPYRRLKNTTTGRWEGSKREKLTYDEFIHAIRHYDSQLKNADKYARRTLKNEFDSKDIDKVFNGLNFQMVLSGKTEGKNYIDMLPFDRLMSSFANMDYRRMLSTPPHGVKNPYEYSDKLETLIHSENTSDMIKKFKDSFKDFQNQQDAIKYLQKNRDQLIKVAYKNIESNPGTARDLFRRARKIKRIIDDTVGDAIYKYKTGKNGKLRLQRWNSRRQTWEDSTSKDAVNTKNFKKVWNEVKKRHREDIIAEWTKGKKGEAYSNAMKAFKKANGKNDKLVLQRIKKRGIQIDYTPDHDVLSALAAHDAIGLLAHRKPSQLDFRANVNEAVYRDLFFEVENLSKAHTKEWKNYFEGNSSKNESIINREMSDRMTQLYEKYYTNYGEDVALQVLFQFASPKFDKSRIVATGHKMYFAPSQKNYGSKINFALNWLARTDLVTTEMKRMIFNEYGSASNRAYTAFFGHTRAQNDLFTSGEDIMMRMDVGSLVRVTETGLLEVRGKFKENPFDFGKESTVEDMLSEIHPGFEGMSVTGSYSEMLKIMGSGNIPQILNLHKSYFIPSAAVTDISRFAPHMATSGYPAFLKARKLGINAYLSRSGDRSTLDPDGTFKQIEPFDNPYKREKDLLEEIQESYSEILCNQGNK